MNKDEIERKVEKIHLLAEQVRHGKVFLSQNELWQQYTDYERDLKPFLSADQNKKVLNALDILSVKDIRLARAERRHSKGLDILYLLYKGILKQRLCAHFEFTTNHPFYELIEEACNKKFFDFFVDIHKFEEKSSVYTWLYRVIHNEIINLLRLQMRLQKKTISMDNIEGCHQEVFQDLGEVLQYYDCNDKIYGQLFNGNDDCLSALILQATGSSIEVIQEKLGKKSPNAVRVFLCECRKKLKYNNEVEDCLKLIHDVRSREASFSSFRQDNSKQDEPDKIQGDEHAELSSDKEENNEKQ